MNARRQPGKEGVPPSVKLHGVRPCSRVLFVKSGSAGDLLLLFPALEWLHSAWPDAEIGLLARQQYADMASILPAGVRYIPIPADEDPKRGLDGAHAKAISGAVEAFAPDLLVACTYRKTWIEAVAAVAAPDARRISMGPALFDGVTVQKLRTGGFQRPAALYAELVAVSEDSHELDKNAALVGHIAGVKLPNLVPRISVPAESLAAADALLLKFGLKHKEFVICNPAGVANVSIKAWPAASFAEVIGGLISRGRPVLLCAHAEEAAIVEEIVRLAGPGDLLHAWLGKPGEFPLMAALASRSRLYFGNDTATLHVAEAVGIPAVAIFGGGTWPRFQPCHPQSVSIVHPLSCFGCGWDCHLGDAPCVKLIQPADVTPVLEDWLGQQTRKGEMQPVVQIAHVPEAWQPFIKKGRETHDSLKRDDADRHAQILELTDLAHRYETESSSRHAQVLKLTELAHRQEKEASDRQAQILKLTGLARSHEKEAVERYAQILELTELARRQKKDIAALNQIAARLQADLSAALASRDIQAAKAEEIAKESADRHAQVVKLTELAHRHEKEAADRYAQILKLTELARSHEKESAARYAQILKLTELARSHEKESAARYAQILEFTELARGHEKEIAFLNQAAAKLQGDILVLRASVDSRDREITVQQTHFRAERRALEARLAGLEADADRSRLRLKEVSAQLELALSAIRNLRESKWVRLGTQIRLLRS